MSEEDVIGKLARFTPGAVDRDAMLFAAGRASVKPPRFWKWAALGLLLSQIVTLGLWFWPKADPMPIAPVVPEVRPSAPDASSVPELDPYSLLALTRNPNVESKSTPLSSSPSRPPLTVFTRNFQP